MVRSKSWNIDYTFLSQRIERIPKYNRGTLEELQANFDDVVWICRYIAILEQVDDHVEYLNNFFLVFLVDKANDESALTNLFTLVAQYCKPRITSMPNVDGVLQKLYKWNYLIITEVFQQDSPSPSLNEGLCGCFLFIAHKYL